MIDYYKILGILPNATTDEVKKAYRQLALKYHPDRNPNDKNSEAFFKKVNEAYSILSNPEERENYNWEYKNSQQTSSNQKHQQKRDEPKSEPKSEPKITPPIILEYFEEIRIKVYSLGKNKVNQSALYNSLNELLNKKNIDFLISWGDLKTNNHIVEVVMSCCKFLTFPFIEILTPKLAKLAGSDNKTIQNIYAFEKQQKYLDIFSRHKGVIIIGAIILFFTIISLLNNKKSSSSSDNRPANGELNNTFIKDNSSATLDKNAPKNIPTLTTEELLQKEKERLVSNGWEQEEINNGQLSSCYNFLPKKSKINNYLEVQVGVKTDVAVKVMDINTNKCVRYVYINGGTTYKISHLPEGSYFLKIAYGKDWYSKVENGKCIGKFLRNQMYEKGDDIMNFNLKYTTNGYRIPSYQLKLDVIASDTLNNFNSEQISENEFND